MGDSSNARVYPDIGLLLLRLSIGGLMLFHGIAKMRGGLEGIMGMLSDKGLPEFMAYGTYVGEVLAPALVVIGLFTRPAALMIAFTMLMSIYLAFGWAGFELGKHGAPKIELNLMYLFGSVCLVLTGDGSLSVRKGAPKWD